MIRGMNARMKKSITTKKLNLKHETLKQLKVDALEGVAGGAPVTTRELPCIPLTGKVACG
jgi:hypothetical protein